MDKTKHDEALSATIAGKVIARMKGSKSRNVIDIRNAIRGHAMVEALQETVVSQDELDGYDPAHAVYIRAQNQVSVISEQLTALKEMAPFVKIISKAEDLYMRAARRVPLTASYFTCWAFFDACAGPANETVGTTILEAGAAFGMHPEMLRAVRLMQDSRMGFYIHRGREGHLSVLEDLVTSAVYRAIVPAGYGGKENEIWYVRLLPSPIPGGKEHIAFTTPYIVLHPDLADWLAYFQRTLPATSSFDDYERHMKYGPTREYWNDYVREAYVNYQFDAIFLAGLPDIPESRPHSRISEERAGRPRPSSGRMN